MPVVKIIEVIGSSPISFDDAVKNAVMEVSQTVRNIESVFVKDLKAKVDEGMITSFGCICKISFTVENGHND